MRVVGIIVGVLLVIAIAVGIYIARNANSLIKNGIETLGSEYLGARVTVDDVDVSLTEGKGAIRGLEIANPAGFDGPYLMQLDQVAVQLNLDELSTTTIVLREVLIDGARIMAIIKGGGSNLKTLMDHLEAKTGGPAEAAKEGAGGETKLIIDKLDFVDARADVEAVLLGKDYTVDVPDVHLTGIGRKQGGATAGEVLRQLLKPVMDGVLREAMKRGMGAEGVEAGLKQKLIEKLPGFGSSNG